MAVELAVGYISLVADASKIPRAVDAALNQASRNVDRHGETFGSKLASGIGKTLKIGLGTATAAATGVIGAALTKGIGRLTAIDDAQGKLRGLGHDAQSVQKIMDSALASVKGTAFGLGEAATTAAGAVAAGIKPGEELTAHLKRVADAATIAGVGMGEMGAIFNKVATADKIQGDVIAQLSDAGIPIVQLLAKELGKTSDQVVAMASAGNINFKQFSDAMQQGMGGAALQSGTTVRGALANVTAALGRLGAAALKPEFGRLTGWFGQLITVIDKATDRVGPLAQKLDAQLFNRVIPKAQQMWQAFNKSGTLDSVVSGIQPALVVLEHLADAAKSAAPSVLSIGKSLSQASASLGVSSWQVLVKVLESAAQIADSVLVPGLSTLAGLMSSNQGAVTALVAAWLAFKTVPGILRPIGTAVAGVQTRAASAVTGLRGIASANSAVVRTANNGSVVMGRFGSAIAQIGTRAPTIARMQSSFVNAAAGASRFGRTAGTAAAAMTGMRSAASGVVNALGGPWALAITAATIAIVKFTSDLQEHRQQVAAVNTAWQELAKTRNDLAKTIQSEGGGFGDKSLANLTSQVDSLNEAIDKAAKNKAGQWSTRRMFKAPWSDTIKNEDFKAKQYEDAQKAIEKLGMSSQSIAQALSNDGSWNQLKTQLEGMGKGGQFAAKNLQWLREEALKAQAVAQNSTSGFFTLSDAVKKLADLSSTATDRLDAMKSALDTLAGVPVSTQDALARYNDQVRQTTELTTEFDSSKGMGSALVDDQGKIDTATENGRKLYDALKGIRDATLDAVNAGNEFGPLAAKNDAQFQQLADAVGLSKDQIVALAASIGYLPDSIQILAELKGASDVTQKLTVISELLKSNSGGIDIPMEVLNDADVRAKLTEAGVKIDDLNAKDGVVHLSAPDAPAVLAELQKIIDKNLPPKTQQVDVKYNDPGLGLGTIQKLHENIDNVPIAPRADGGIDNLPSAATIQGPQRGLIQWAEPGTGGEAFIPLASSKRGRSMQILSKVADHFGVGLAAYADGGINGVPLGVARALNAARSVTGVKYKWGGTSVDGFDCSGLIGYLQQLIMGIIGSTTRLYTTTSLLAGQTAGLKSGRGPSGTYFTVGVNSQHMAATLDGQPVEAGGSHGDSRIGYPAVGADDSQFTAHFYLPNELIDGINSAKVNADNYSGTSTSSKSTKNQWTAQDDLDLQQKQLDLDQAKADRDKVYKDAKSTDIDKRRADLKVQQAQQDLTDKQAEKDKKLSGTGATPEAPALTSRLTDEEISAKQAQISLQEAQQSRNEVYANPDSTDLEKQKADLEVQSAENSLDKANKTEWSSSFAGKSWDLAKSTAFGLLGAFASGISEMLPFGFGDLFKITVNTPSDEDLAKRGVSAKLTIGNNFSLGSISTGSFSAEEISKQLPITIPSGVDARKALQPYINQAPASVLELLQPKAKVFDSGGWLEPGQMAVNLSKKPEPIFSSPQQLREFTGTADLSQSSGGGSTGDTFNVTNNGMDPHAAARAMERVIRRKTLASQIKGGFGRA